MINCNSQIKNFWIIFFALLAVVAIASAVVVGVVASRKLDYMRMSVVEDENYYKVSEENNYKRALYATCDSLKNLDASLGKAAIARDSGNLAQLLTDAVIHANHINQNLANLPFADSDNLFACQSFVNQAQDYATYLLKKTVRGEQLSASERAALRSLDNVATGLYNFLQAYAEGDSGMFITNGNGMNNQGALSNGLDEVDENTFRYEKLIYDGPFSESVEHKKIKMGKKISAEEGSKMVEELFGANTFAHSIKRDGLWYVYNVQNGQVTLTCDGRVVQYEAYTEEHDGVALDKETCIARAEEFCQRFGYDVKGVWVSKTQDATTYVNCATVVDGVVVYPDLVKVAVDSFSGQVVGCEARAYLTNHHDWDVSFGDVEEETARKTLDAELKVTNVAKALVEKNHKYFACYEFQCEADGRQYYVYVDSRTCAEVEIFKVIKNTEGYTVM